MKLTVQCFGAARRWCGAEKIELDLGDGETTVAAAERILAQRFPDFAEQTQHMAYAVGDEIVDRKTSLRPEDTLVLIAPVSGG